MKRFLLALFLSLFVIALMPVHADTYYGGYEDTVGGDYDRVLISPIIRVGMHWHQRNHK